MQTKFSAQGMTLIELVIVVTVVGIIAAIGYPSYIDQVRKTRRTEGMSGLLQLANRMERHYSDTGSYSRSDGSDMTAAIIFRSTTRKGHYTLSVDSGTNKIEFTARATPTGKGRQNRDNCGTFIFHSQGKKDVSGGSLPAADCWK